MFRELSRKKNEISTEECIHILSCETRGVLSVLGDDGYPYGTPMNHWYNKKDGCIYFHCGKVGHRLDALRRDNKVSFCVYDRGVRPEGEWAFRVKSVIVFGTIDILDNIDTIADITTKLSHKFTTDDTYIQEEIARSGKNTLLLRLKPQHMCGKQVTEA